MTQAPKYGSSASLSCSALPPQSHFLIRRAAKSPPQRVAPGLRGASRYLPRAAHTVTSFTQDAERMEYPQFRARLHLQTLEGMVKGLQGRVQYGDGTSGGAHVNDTFTWNDTEGPWTYDSAYETLCYRRRRA
jgi:hypothetical protein